MSKAEAIFLFFTLELVSILTLMAVCEAGALLKVL